MTVYRICARQHASDINGTGAALYPGRWNKKGIPVLYTSESKELALLENLVHAPPHVIPELDLLTIKIPDNSLSVLRPSELPANWFHYPFPAVLSDLGHHWIRQNKSLALKVPSCIVHSANNILINCRHPKFKQVKIIEQKAFQFDSRLRK